MATFGRLVTEAGTPTVIVGWGRPGVADKLIGAGPDVRVMAEAVYSPFNVAKVSGVAELPLARLHASWTIIKITTKRVKDCFFREMFSPKQVVQGKDAH